ncbi:MAG TPA: GNAT family N-acetyltransferase [Bacilli bacterium]|nr:GNAT family N-acetyltransferase [Bacilli bacterium]
MQRTTKHRPIAFAYVQRYTAKNGQTVTLRPARPEDAPTLVKKIARVVREGSFLEEDESTLSTSREEAEEIRKMRREGSMYTVAVVDGEVVGAAMLKRGQLEMHRHTCDYRIWIGPNYRGLGIGKRFMLYSIDWARAHGLRKFCLDVFSNNERAIDLYKKYGFIVEGRRRDQYFLEGRYVDEIFMSLFLV